jgi:hypothetical protein
MIAPTKPRGEPQVLDDCEIGDIVRCHAGTVRVGPPLAGDLFCLLVEALEPDSPSETDYRDIAGPIFMAKRTPVLARLRGRTWYESRKRGGGKVPDPADVRS